MFHQMHMRWLAGKQLKWTNLVLVLFHKGLGRTQFSTVHN